MNKTFLLHITIGASLAMAGCFNPFRPSIEHVHICSTKPRLYILPSGEQRFEVDTYRSEVPCPAEPID